MEEPVYLLDDRLMSVEIDPRISRHDTAVAVGDPEIEQSMVTDCPVVTVNEDWLITTLGKSRKEAFKFRTRILMAVSYTLINLHSHRYRYLIFISYSLLHQIHEIV